MKHILAASRNALLTAEDTICLERGQLVTDYYRENDDEPVVLRRAGAFAHVLRNMSLDLETNPVFAGNTSSRPRAWMLLPEYGFQVPSQAIVENPCFEGFLDGDAIPSEMRGFWQGGNAGDNLAGIGHLTVDLRRVLQIGLEGIMGEAQMVAENGTVAQRQFGKACLRSCKAVIDWSQRYVLQAQDLASREEGLRKKLLLRVADACRRVPAQPASNLFEALQSIVLIQMAIHIEGHGYSVSPGCLDRYLAPYWEPGQDATELLAAFLLKLSSVSTWGSHSKTQCITLGGVDHLGRDQCNALTVQVMDAFDLVRMPDPHMFLRWHAKIDSDVKEKAVDLLAMGLSMPMLVGDEQTATGLENSGVSKEDAWDYCVVGCNEIGIPGKLIFRPVLVNDALVLSKALEELCLDGSSPLPTGRVLEVVGEKFRQQCQAHVCQANSRFRSLGHTGPTPFTSVLMHDCITKGQDMHFSLEYDYLTLMEIGFTNLVNSLFVIETLVCGNKLVSLPEFLTALAADFQGYNYLEAAINNLPKWGEDNPAVDAWALAWLRVRQRVQEQVAETTNLELKLSSHVVRSLHHLFGQGLPATPDGRRTNAPLADSVGPVGGVSRFGPTAMLNSVRKLEPKLYWTGGYNLNLTLPPAHGDKEQIDNMKGLVDAFFAAGGQELQMNFLDPVILADAKCNPENYSSLMVRVAGFNALFTRLSPGEQDEIIVRAKLARD